MKIQNKTIRTMEKTSELSVRLYAPKKNVNPCYTPLRFAVSYKRKRLYCTINVPAPDADQLQFINFDGSLKNPSQATPDAEDTAATIQVIMGKLRRIAEEAIRLGDWDAFTSADFKGIVSCLYFWENDPEAITIPSDSLCWQWLCRKNEV